jgi:hypothetical protein
VRGRIDGAPGDRQHADRRRRRPSVNAMIRVLAIAGGRR